MALVGFEIGPDGVLRSASVLRSSGSDAIDRTAIAYITWAAQFPPPPQGAERGFQVRNESRH